MYEARTNDASSEIGRDFLDFQLCLAVERTATLEGADGRNEYNFVYTRFMSGLEQPDRAVHINAVNFVPFHQLEIIRTMYQDANAVDLENSWLNGRFELEGHMDGSLG
ncbi:MAG TPA: hypothetical protein VK638_52900 [Edaphobacter sp.]|nr:hypothetical protein [Edaphobacter sp.]